MTPSTSSLSNGHRYSSSFRLRNKYVTVCNHIFGRPVPYVCVRVSERASERACVRACACVCAHARLFGCLSVYVRARVCVRARTPVRVCVCVRARVSE